MKVIAVHFYVGADGPTVRFVLASTEQAELLKGLFMKMATADRSVQFAIHQDARFFLQGLSCFTWRTDPSARASSFTITEDLAEWCLSPDRWEHGAGLMDGLIEAGAGHQYLTSADSDGALVVVALGEDLGKSPSFS